MQRDKIQSKKIQMKQNKRIPKTYQTKCKVTCETNYKNDNIQKRQNTK